MIYVSKHAVMSPDHLYRYLLTRVWNTSLPKITFIGLNPSTADADVDDATIRTEVAFADRWGYGGLIKVNLFAYRATDPAEMKRQSNPIGLLNERGENANNEHIFEAAAKAHRLVAAWGAHGTHMERDNTVLKLLTNRGFSLFCLGWNKDGTPKHPLYMRRDTPLRFYV
jgi:hypothetical protein